MSRYKEIVFLDEEGTGLSPYAKVLLEWKLKKAGIDFIDVFARGNVVLFEEPANQKIAELARQKGLNLEGYSSAQITGEEFSESTLVITFNSQVKQKVYDVFPNASNVFMIREFIGEAGDIKLPVGASLNEYDAICAIVDRTTDKLLEKLLND